MNSILSNINQYILYFCIFLSVIALIQLLRFLSGIKKVAEKSGALKSDLDRIADKAEEINRKEKKIEGTFKKTSKSLTAVSIFVLINSLLKDRNSKNKNGNKGIIQEYRESNKARKIIHYAAKLK